jgi:hypothetical protein
MTALIGLCFALRPIGVVRRLGCAGLAFIGVAVIYYTQVRSIFLVLAISLAVLTALLMAQGRFGSALALVGGSVGTVVGSLFWVARRMGSGVYDRFGTLVAGDPGELYYRSRGGYVQEAFTKLIWDYPLGYGLGWWGMIYATFRNPNRFSPIWVEVMIPAWIYDGGAPLLVLYVGAVVVAVLNSLRIALRSNDPDVSFWAAVVVALDVSTVALCFSFVAFVNPIGLQFWLLNAALHAADALARARPLRLPAAARRPRLPRPWPPGPAPR